MNLTCVRWLGVRCGAVAQRGLSHKQSQHWAWGDLPVLGGTLLEGCRAMRNELLTEFLARDLRSAP